ncbi:MAG: hypothetical protein OER43_16025 [Gammaproteobacteria bacterium]|nr:hypothetical protein [Gammaproteobacteria bacterium]MDH3413974.1 hypothetical protein [Gammaproteobacteria bacterium]
MKRDPGPLTPTQVAAGYREAWNQGQFGFFRWFTAYPVLYRVDTGNPSTCVWFQDLRFFTPGRGRWPFRFRMCRGKGGAWEPFQLVGENTRIPAAKN